MRSFQIFIYTSENTEQIVAPLLYQNAKLTQVNEYKYP